MIKWTDIDNEVEEFQSGYRSGFVSIFNKYKGMETDEKDGGNRTVTVNQATFARRYGINESTFKDWVRDADGRPSPSRTGLNEKMAKAASEAAAKATAEAEAKGAQALSNALAKQAKESELAQRKALLAAKQEAEKEAKAEAARIRKEEQDKATAAYNKEITALKSKLAEEAKKAEFDLSTLSEKQKAQLMTMLANDPDRATEFFEASRKERDRKNAEALEKNRQDAERKKSQMAERESRQAAERASKEYNASALKLFFKWVEDGKKIRERFLQSGVSFDHILMSGRTAHECVSDTEFAEDFSVEMREAIFTANAEQELSDITE